MIIARLPKKKDTKVVQKNCKNLQKTGQLWYLDKPYFRAYDKAD